MSRRDLKLAPAPVLSPQQKMQLALEMADHGMAMKRRSLGRANPHETDQQIELRLRAWLMEPR